MSLAEVVHSMVAGDDADWPTTMRRARAWAVRSKWALLAGVLLLLFLPLRWVFPSWTLRQLALLDSLAVFPATAEQIVDVNFWGGQIVSLLVVTTTTWLLLNSQSIWEQGLLNSLFIATWQKVVFKHFLLGSLQDKVFTFFSRQLTMVFTGLFLPNYNSAPEDVSTGEWWRWFIDARMCTGWYILTAAVWYGYKIGLFRMPVHVAHYMAPLPFVLHFFGVATLRIYPALNRAGIDLPSAVFLLVFRFPIVTMALGCLAVWPPMVLGARIKAQTERRYSQLLVLYLLHVVSVMWASQAGQYLGDELVRSYPDFAIDLNTLITVCCRLLIVAVMGMVAYFYGHAVHVLYLSSPLFMCDWEDPEFQFVKVQDNVMVVSQLKQSYKKYFLDREHLNNNEPQSRTRMLVGFFRHVMGLSIAIRSLWRGRGTLKLAMRFRVKVTNGSARDFKLNRVRIEVTTQHRREVNGRSVVGPRQHLMTLAVQGIHVKGNDKKKPLEVTVHGAMVIKAMLKLARVSMDGDPLERMDVVLYSESTVSKQLEFSMPLLSYYKGRFHGVMRNTNFDPQGTLWRNRSKLLRLTRDVRRRQEQLLGKQLQQEHIALQGDLEKLNNVLARLSRARVGRAVDESDADSEIVDQLLEAAYFIVSVYEKECDLHKNNIALPDVGEDVAMRASTTPGASGGAGVEPAVAGGRGDELAVARDDDAGSEAGAGAGADDPAAQARGSTRKPRELRAFRAALLRSTSLLMDLGYEFTVARVCGGTEPAHLVVMGCSLVVILGMIDDRLNPLGWIGDAGARDEDDEDDAGSGGGSGGDGGARAPILDDPSFRDEDAVMLGRSAPVTRQVSNSSAAAASSVGDWTDSDNDGDMDVRTAQPPQTSPSPSTMRRRRPRARPAGDDEPEYKWQPPSHGHDGGSAHVWQDDGAAHAWQDDGAMSGGGGGAPPVPAARRHASGNPRPGRPRRSWPRSAQRGMGAAPATDGNPVYVPPVPTAPPAPLAAQLPLPAPVTSAWHGTRQPGGVGQRGSAAGTAGTGNGTLAQATSAPPAAGPVHATADPESSSDSDEVPPSSSEPPASSVLPVRHAVASAPAGLVLPRVPAHPIAPVQGPPAAAEAAAGVPQQPPAGPVGSPTSDASASSVEGWVRVRTAGTTAQAGALTAAAAPLAGQPGGDVATAGAAPAPSHAVLNREPSGDDPPAPSDTDVAVGGPR